MTAKEQSCLPIMDYPPTFSLLEKKENLYPTWATVFWVSFQQQMSLHFNNAPFPWDPLKRQDQS